ncbi:MAG: alpha/beta hydrolase, partial [Oxalobacteraceae bacterium]
MKFRSKLVLAASALLSTTPAVASAETVKNIVLVHGAWADGSGWKPVFDILTRKGYH